jgi:hypothetical protein
MIRSHYDTEIMREILRGNPHASPHSRLVRGVARRRGHEQRAALSQVIRYGLPPRCGAATFVPRSRHDTRVARLVSRGRDSRRWPDRLSPRSTAFSPRLWPGFGSPWPRRDRTSIEIGLGPSRHTRCRASAEPHMQGDVVAASHSNTQKSGTRPASNVGSSLARKER